MDIMFTRERPTSPAPSSSASSSSSGTIRRATKDRSGSRRRNRPSLEGAAPPVIDLDLDSTNNEPPVPINDDHHPANHGNMAPTKFPSEYSLMPPPSEGSLPSSRPPSEAASDMSRPSVSDPPPSVPFAFSRQTIRDVRSELTKLGNGNLLVFMAHLLSVKELHKVMGYRRDLMSGEESAPRFTTPQGPSFKMPDVNPALRPATANANVSSNLSHAMEELNNTIHEVNTGQIRAQAVGRKPRPSPYDNPTPGPSTASRVKQGNTIPSTDTQSRPSDWYTNLWITKKQVSSTDTPSDGSPNTMSNHPYIGPFFDRMQSRASNLARLSCEDDTEELVTENPALSNPSYRKEAYSNLMNACQLILDRKLDNMFRSGSVDSRSTSDLTGSWNCKAVQKTLVRVCQAIFTLDERIQITSSSNSTNAWSRKAALRKLLMAHYSYKRVKLKYENRDHTLFSPLKPSLDALLNAAKAWFTIEIRRTHQAEYGHISPTIATTETKFQPSSSPIIRPSTLNPPVASDNVSTTSGLTRSSLAEHKIPCNCNRQKMARKQLLSSTPDFVSFPKCPPSASRVEHHSASASRQEDNNELVIENPSLSSDSYRKAVYRNLMTTCQLILDQKLSRMSIIKPTDTRSMLDGLWNCQTVQKALLRVCQTIFTPRKGIQGNDITLTDLSCKTTFITLLLSYKYLRRVQMRNEHDHISDSGISAHTAAFNAFLKSAKVWFTEEIRRQIISTSSTSNRVSPSRSWPNSASNIKHEPNTTTIGPTRSPSVEHHPMPGPPTPRVSNLFSPLPSPSRAAPSISGVSSCPSSASRMNQALNYIDYNVDEPIAEPSNESFPRPPSASPAHPKWFVEKWVAGRAILGSDVESSASGSTLGRKRQWQGLEEEDEEENWNRQWMPEDE